MDYSAEIWLKSYDVTLFNQLLSVPEQNQRKFSGRRNQSRRTEQILFSNTRDGFILSKKNVETFAKWLISKLNLKVQEKCKKQSVRTNTAFKNIQKIK